MDIKLKEGSQTARFATALFSADNKVGESSYQMIKDWNASKETYAPMLDNTSDKIMTITEEIILK